MALYFNSTNPLQFTQFAIFYDYYKDIHSFKLGKEFWDIDIPHFINDTLQKRKNRFYQLDSFPTIFNIYKNLKIIEKTINEEDLKEFIHHFLLSYTNKRFEPFCAIMLFLQFNSAVFTGYTLNEKFNLGSYWISGTHINKDYLNLMEYSMEHVFDLKNCDKVEPEWNFKKIDIVTNIVRFTYPKRDRVHKLVVQRYLRKIFNKNIPDFKAKKSSNIEKLRYHLKNKREMLFNFIVTCIFYFGTLSSLTTYFNYFKSQYWLLGVFPIYMFVTLGFVIDILIINYQIDLRENNFCNGNLFLMDGFMGKGDDISFTVSENHIEFSEKGLGFRINDSYMDRSYRNFGYKLWFIKFEEFELDLKTRFCQTKPGDIEFNCFNFQLGPISTKREYSEIFNTAVKDLIIEEFDGDLFSSKLTSAIKSKIQTCYKYFFKHHNLHHLNVHASPKYRSYFMEKFLPWTINIEKVLLKDDVVYLDIPQMCSIQENEVVQILKYVVEEELVLLQYKLPREVYAAYLANPCVETLCQKLDCKRSVAKKKEKDIQSSIAYYKNIDPDWLEKDIYVSKEVKSLKKLNVVQPKKSRTLICKSLKQKGVTNLTEVKLNEKDNNTKISERKFIHLQHKLETVKKSREIEISNVDLESLKKLKNRHQNEIRRRYNIRRKNQNLKKAHRLTPQQVDESKKKMNEITILLSNIQNKFEEIFCPYLKIKPMTLMEEQNYLDHFVSWNLLKWKIYKIRNAIKPRRVTDRIIDLKCKLKKMEILKIIKC